MDNKEEDAASHEQYHQDQPPQRMATGLSVNSLLNNDDDMKKNTNQTVSHRQIKALPTRTAAAAASTTSSNSNQHPQSIATQPQSQSQPPSTSSSASSAKQAASKKSKASSNEKGKATSVLQETVPDGSGISYQYTAIRQEVENRENM